MRNQSKMVRSLFLLLVFALVAVFLYGILDRGSSNKKTKQVTKPFSSSQTHKRHLIRGLKYISNSDKGVRISIEADQFHIEKKKIGFLRFGLLNVAKLKNAKISIVKTAKKPKKGAIFSENSIPPKKASQSLSNNHHVQKNTEGIILDSAEAILKVVNTSNFLPGISTKRIFSFEIAPIELQVSEDDLTSIKITAGRANFDAKNKKVVLTENVIFVSEKYSWRGEEFKIDPVSGIVTRKEINRQEGKM